MRREIIRGGGNAPDQVTAQTLDEQNDASTKYTAADVLDSDGYPKGSNGGKDSVHADDPDADWSFESASMLDTSLTGQMTLVLKKGTFDFRGSTVRCPVKISSSAKLLGGTFTETVYSATYSYDCINGVFLKRPEGHYAEGSITGALRCVEMYTDPAIGTLSYTVNGEPLDGKKFYYTSYDESADYKQEIAIACSGEGTNLIKSWKAADAGFQSIISRGRSLTRASYSSSNNHTCTISVSSNDITQLHITVSGSVSTYYYLDLTAQTTADPDEAYKVTVPCATLYTADDEGNRQPLTDPSKVKPGTKVYIEYDADAAKEQYGDDFTFSGWKLTSSTPLGDDANLIDESGWFTMPDDDVTLELIVPAPDVPGEDPGDGSGVSPDGVAGAIVAGAVIGATGYAAVTHVWLESIFGFVPTNRQQLALALWEKADKPQPQSSTLYSDISAEDADAQAAARWCAEQGLMKDFDEDFKPGHYVFRLQAIKAWNDLQAQLKADK